MKNPKEMTLRVWSAAGCTYDPPSQFFVDAFFRLGVRLRKDRDPGKHAALRNIPQTDCLHIANGLNGNLARLELAIGPKLIIGEKWVGSSTGSFVATKVAASQIRDNTVILRPIGRREKKRIEVVRGERVDVFAPGLPSPCRTHDSEYLLLNYLFKLLSGVLSSLKSELVLVSERVPCRYCTDVIRRFCLEYPNVTCNVVYLFETDNRPGSALLDSLLPINVRLFKGSIGGSGGEIVPIVKQDVIYDVNEKVLEQSELMDSCAHIMTLAEGFTVARNSRTN